MTLIDPGLEYLFVLLTLVAVKHVDLNQFKALFFKLEEFFIHLVFDLLLIVVVLQVCKVFVSFYQLLAVAFNKVVLLMMVISLQLEIQLINQLVYLTLCCSDLLNSREWLLYDFCGGFCQAK